jgi:hypothetical protein
VQRTIGHVVVNLDDEGSRPIVTAARQRGNCTTFGRHPESTVRIMSVQSVNGGL